MTAATAPVVPHRDPALRVVGLGKQYPEAERPHWVLDGLDFEVATGDCVALIGRSGSGKSTLLNLLAGIDRPDRGRVEILGQSLSALGEPAVTLLRRRHIGFIYQFFNLIPTLRVDENVAFPLELAGFPAAERRRRVEAMLERLGLADRAHAFPDQLSGGEQQRVAIGRALVHQPSLVLADEPTGNLDAETGTQILALLRELFAERQQTLLLVTHSRAVSAIADRVLTLDHGRLVAAPPETAW